MAAPRPGAALPLSKLRLSRSAGQLLSSVLRITRRPRAGRAYGAGWDCQYVGDSEPRLQPLTENAHGFLLLLLFLLYHPGPVDVIRPPKRIDIPSDYDHVGDGVESCINVLKKEGSVTRSGKEEDFL